MHIAAHFLQQGKRSGVICDHNCHSSATKCHVRMHMILVCRQHSHCHAWATLCCVQLHTSLQQGMPSAPICVMLPALRSARICAHKRSNTKCLYLHSLHQVCWLELYMILARLALCSAPLISAVQDGKLLYKREKPMSFICDSHHCRSLATRGSQR